MELAQARSEMSALVRFHLTVDDAGEFLAVEGDELVVGHVKNRAADLPILADVLERHALFSFRGASFHTGAAWILRATDELVASGRSLSIDGREVRGDCALSGDERIELSKLFALRFRLPDPASSSALLEFERGVECLGAQRAILFARGSGGRVRIGRRSRSHVRVQRLEAEVALELGDAGLRIESSVPLSRDGASPLAEHALDRHVSSRTEFALSRAALGAPPFVIGLAPIA